MKRRVVITGLGGVCGLGTDVAGGPDASIFSVMQVGAYAQAALRTVAGETRPVLGPLDWLRLGSLDGARASTAQASRCRSVATWESQQPTLQNI